MRKVVALAAAAFAALALMWWFRSSHRQSVQRQPAAAMAAERIAGGDGGGLPRATPAEEHIDAAALAGMGVAGSAEGLRAFIVMRHGHIVYERYGTAVNGDTPIDGGEFARTLLVLAAGTTAGAAAQRLTNDGRALDTASLLALVESSSGQPYPAYLSRRLWSRLNAADAWIEHAPGSPVPVDCCLHARLLDWMRMAALLVEGGRFEGSQIVPAEWLLRMQRPLSPSSLEGAGVELAAAAAGAGRFAAPDVFFVRGPQRWRLWLVPSLQLAILFGSDLPARSEAGSIWDEFQLPNAVIRAVLDRAPQPGDADLLQQLVPGH